MVHMKSHGLANVYMSCIPYNNYYVDKLVLAVFRCPSTKLDINYIVAECEGQSCRKNYLHLELQKEGIKP